ncbi:hypothetical protein D3C71_1242770 [compost metagenome]
MSHTYIGGKQLTTINSIRAGGRTDIARRHTRYARTFHVHQPAVSTELNHAIQIRIKVVEVRTQRIQLEPVICDTPILIRQLLRMPSQSLSLRLHQGVGCKELLPGHCIRATRAKRSVGDVVDTSLGSGLVCDIHNGAGVLRTEADVAAGRYLTHQSAQGISLQHSAIGYATSGVGRSFRRGRSRAHTGHFAIGGIELLPGHCIRAGRTEHAIGQILQLALGATLVGHVDDGTGVVCAQAHVATCRYLPHQAIQYRHPRLRCVRCGLHGGNVAVGGIQLLAGDGLRA